MELTNAKLLAIDLHTSEILSIDLASQIILARIPYLNTYTPIGFFINTAKTKACLAATTDDEGALFIVDIATNSLYRLPAKLPHLSQIILTDDFRYAYLVDHTATLYHFDTTSLNLTPIVNPDIDSCHCNGISLMEDIIYTIWENEEQGVIAGFSAQGEIKFERFIGGIPTNLHVLPDKIIVTFTKNKLYGEGMAIFPLDETNAPTYLVINPADNCAISAYPCHIALNDEKSRAYITNEDSGSISMIDLLRHEIIASIQIGRSITTLSLLPDNRFAIAASNMFADLSLIDLVNRRLIAVSEIDAELSSWLCLY